MPVPPDADSPKFKTTVGSVKYVPEQVGYSLIVIALVLNTSLAINKRRLIFSHFYQSLSNIIYMLYINANISLQDAVIWSIKSFPGGKEFLMRAHFGLPSVEREDTEGKPPIYVRFEIPYFTTSGIQVSFVIYKYLSQCRLFYH